MMSEPTFMLFDTEFYATKWYAAYLWGLGGFLMLQALKLSKIKLPAFIERLTRLSFYAAFSFPVSSALLLSGVLGGLLEATGGLGGAIIMCLLFLVVTGLDRCLIVIFMMKRMERRRLAMKVYWWLSFMTSLLVNVALTHPEV